MNEAINSPHIDFIIPAVNEEHSIGKVINDIPKDITRHIIVCNNGSTDRTKEVALGAGAIVVDEPKSGYGQACLKGMEYLEDLSEKPDIVVFLDGDYSDYPEHATELIKPITNKGFDMVIGSRVKGDLQPGSMTVPQVFGNWLATTLIKIIYNYDFSDLGPFRAIRYQALMDIDMQDKDYGWTVEMQVKAAKMGLRCTEIPINYRRRIGTSKVSGTIKGTILAGHKILWTIFKLI